MKRNQYICPMICIFSIKAEGHLAELSGTHTGTPSGGSTEGPENGGGGDESETAKRYNAWDTWDD